MDRGELSFEVDGQYLGVAFTGLQGQTVYPIVSAVWGHCEVKMNYIGGLERKYFFYVYFCVLNIFNIHLFNNSGPFFRFTIWV